MYEDWFLQHKNWTSFFDMSWNSRHESFKNVFASLQKLPQNVQQHKKNT